MYVYFFPFKKNHKGWKDGSAVNSSDGSCRGPGLGSQHHGVAPSTHSLSRGGSQPLELQV